MTRTTLLSGPASATFNGHTYFAYDGIVVTPALQTGEATDRVESDARGTLDDTVSQMAVTIKFVPSSPFADLAALYPWTMAAPGTSLFGASDSSLVLIASNGVRLTFSAAAIIAMPDLHLTSRGPVAGAVTFLALGARSMPITAMNRFVTIDTAAVPLPPQGTQQLMDDFAITWGAAPWMNLRSRDGVKIHFALETSPVLSDANALLDLTLERLEVEARFVPSTPESLSENDLIDALQLQGAGALPGRSLATTAETLDLAGEHLFVRLPLAQLIRGELAFDATRARLGELVFVSERAFVGVDEPEALVNLTEGLPTT